MNGSPPAIRRPRRCRLWYLTVAATLPYLVLKTLWVLGLPVGQRDPAVMLSAPYPQANLISLVVDAAVIGLAGILCSGRPGRVGVLFLAAAMWTADGLLVPIVLIVPLALPAAIAEGVGGPSDVLHLWVYLMVYASLIAQAVLLNIAFLRFLQQARKPPDTSSAARHAGSVDAGPGLLVCGSAASVLALASGVTSGWSAATGSAGAGPVDRTAAAGHASLLIMAALAVSLLLVGIRGGISSGKRRAAIAAVWVGSGVTVTWSSYELAVMQVMARPWSSARTGSSLSWSSGRGSAPSPCCWCINDGYPQVRRLGALGPGEEGFPSAAEVGLRGQSDELLRVSNGVDGRNQVVLDAQGDHGVDLTIDPQKQRRPSVDVGELSLPVEAGHRRHTSVEEAAHLLGSEDRSRNCSLDPTTITEGHHVGSQDVDEWL